MGTNYYIKREEKPKCEHCGRGPELEVLHIGKQSMGWKFTFAVHDIGAENFDDMLEVLQKNQHCIFDEYGDQVDLADLIENIKLHQKGLNIRTYYTKYPEHKREGLDQYIDDNYFTDAKGYEFSRGEFS